MVNTITNAFSRVQKVLCWATPMWIIGFCIGVLTGMSTYQGVSVVVISVMLAMASVLTLFLSGVRFQKLSASWKTDKYGDAEILADGLAGIPHAWGLAILVTGLTFGSIAGSSMREMHWDQTQARGLGLYSESLEGDPMKDLANATSEDVVALASQCGDPRLVNLAIRYSKDPDELLAIIRIILAKE